jgi:hypothetical protein
MEQIWIVDDLGDGSTKVIRSLEDLKAGRGNFIIHSRITGTNLKVERWGTSANEEFFVKHF